MGRLRLLFAAVIVLGTLMSPQPIRAFFEVNKYAGASGGSTFYGVASFIRASGTIMVDPNTNFHAHWIGLVRSAPIDHWVQVGQFQGTGGIPGLQISASSPPDAYWENVDGCDFYRLANVGQPATPNRRYAVAWTGTSANVPECGLQAKFAVYANSIYDPPVGTAYMANQLGVPWAATEIRGNEDIGNNYFGVDLNFNPTTTTGIKLYRPANGWLTWTQGLASQVDRNFGLFRVDLADHYSFRTHD